MSEGAVDIVHRCAQLCGDKGLGALHCGRPGRAQAAAGVGQRDQPGAPVYGVALAAYEPAAGEPVEMVGERGRRLSCPAGELARRHGLGTTDLVNECELLGRNAPCGQLALEQAPS